MPLRGTAVLGIWNDLSNLDEEDYDAWLTHEHMPERMEAPGFLRGRKYISAEPGDHRYFNMYEVSSVHNLQSPEYIRMLNSPSEWTRRIMPCLSHFVRAALRIVASRGDDVGGAAATLRFSVAPDATAPPTGAIDDLLDEILAHRAVTAVHLGTTETAATRGMTTERTMRGGQREDGDLAYMLLVESANYGRLKSLVPELRRLIEIATQVEESMHVQLYQLSFLLR
jgi:hypothetical protein